MKRTFIFNKGVVIMSIFTKKISNIFLMLALYYYQPHTIDFFKMIL